LWGDAFTDKTDRLDIDDLLETDKIGSLVIPVFAPLVGFTIRINGAKDPIQLSGKTKYLLGRADPKHDVNPDIDLGPYGGQQLGVSRKHAYLIQVDNGLSIRDLDSTNGTTVNGQIISANQDRPLRDGDEVRLGKLAFNIYFVTNPDPS